MTPAGVTIVEQLLGAARQLRDDCDQIRFSSPITHVYNPLHYAYAPYEQYVRRFGNAPKHVVFLGMNPGPFGMMQTGIPFGEVAAVRDWMQIQAQVDKPASQHGKRPIDGFACSRSEVSGKRLWAWAANQFGSAENFFGHSYVLNYCPLVFLEASGRNFTPDKLPAVTARQLAAACDRHLVLSLNALQPRWAIGVGAYAAKRLQLVLLQARATEDAAVTRAWALPKVIQILHPSPASPVANRGWEQAIVETLVQHRVYA